MAATNGWDQYLGHIMGFYSAKQEKFTKQGVCHSCAIYGLDGALWAASDKWKGFSEYDHTVEGLGNESTNVRVNEFKCVEAASLGNRNPSAAGIRMGGEKYIMNSSEDGLSQLARNGGGGASVARSGKALVIGIWQKDAMMSTNTVQNAGDVAIGVERVAKFMKVAGF